MVEPASLAQTLRHYDFAYLITVNSRMRSHVVPAAPVLAGGQFVLEALGSKSRANVSEQDYVTLLWPPFEAGGYSLIVDGHGERRDNGLKITPTRAVLHRDSSEGGTTPVFAPSSACGADCVELVLDQD